MIGSNQLGVHLGIYLLESDQLGTKKFAFQLQKFFVTDKARFLFAPAGLLYDSELLEHRRIEIAVVRICNRQLKYLFRYSHSRAKYHTHTSLVCLDHCLNPI